MISIWWKNEDGNYEKVDSASSQKEADYLAFEYAMAFRAWPYDIKSKNKVWAGRKDQEPDEKSHL